MTTISTPTAGTNGIVLQDPLATLSDLRVASNVNSVNNQAIRIATASAGGTRISHVTIDGSSGNAVTAVRILGTNDLAHVTINMPLNANTIGVWMDAASTVPATIRQSRITASKGVYVLAHGSTTTSVLVDRTVIEHNGTGVSVASDVTGPTAQTYAIDSVRVTNSVIAATTATPATAPRYGLYVFSGLHTGTGTILGGSVFSSRIDVAGSTVIGTDPTYDSAAMVNGYDEGNVAVSSATLVRATLVANATAFLGNFKPGNEFIGVGCPTLGSANVSCNVTATFTNSLLDPASKNFATGTAATFGGGNLNIASTNPMLVSSPPFSATSDLRPRLGSPLIDAGGVSTLTAPEPSDVNGALRPVGRATDIGAAEFQHAAPTVTITNGLHKPYVAGDPVTITGTVADVDPGDSAVGTWTLPSGATTAGTTAQFTAPASPGEYAVTLTGTDTTGQSTSVTGTLMVVAAPTTNTTTTETRTVTSTVEVPAKDTTAPSMNAVIGATTAKAVRTGKPVWLTLTLNEPALATSKLYALVKIGRTTYPVLLATQSRAAWLGTSKAALQPGKKALAALALKLKPTGARLIAVRTITTAKDAAGNTTPAVTTNRAIR